MKRTFEKLEELLENPLFCAIAKGISIVATITLAVLTIVAIVATCYDTWWLLALIPCVILTGVSAGLAYYLMDEF